ncbi:helix-turn-helix domain-containing protein [Alkalihalobacillus oceani]|uniref:Helix-turn-helix domain-containing protein n=1 Tax=Halalkalibacter oceani TaxID=1653776 RepID=A0A9X2DW48_9BACI|nr:helix-turn-helix domain-containing protein [Halalkalibacter oceani]MCM3716637.1 helix-turn-helix domain-containing protein [Halalkalibacter oceani]
MDRIQKNEKESKIKEINVQVGERLRNARKHAGFSQAEAGEELGVNNVSLSNIERGRTPITVALLIMAAELYNVDVSSLLKGIKDKKTTDVDISQVALFQDRLIELRTSAGISRDQLAEMTSLTAEEIREYESTADKLPKLQDLFDLAVALDVSMHYLGGWINDKEGYDEDLPKPIELTEFLNENMLLYEGVAMGKEDREMIKKTLYLVFFEIKRKQKKEILTNKYN